MAEKQKTNGDSVSRGVAVLAAGLALAVGFFLGFTVHGFLGGKGESLAPVAQQAPEVSAPSKPTPPPPAGGLADRIQALEKQVQLEPNNPDAWTTLGNLYFDTNQPDKAIAAYGKSLLLRPNEPDVLTDQGVMYRQIGQFDKALDCFTKAIALNPSHIIASFNKSIVLEHDKHDRAGALAALKELAARNPSAVLPGGRSVTQAIEDMATGQ